MFWERFQKLCEKQNKKAAPILEELNIASGCSTKWKNGATPKTEHLIKIADYFNVTLDYLVGREIKKPSTASDEERLEDELWNKITRLDDLDKNKTEAYVDGLLAADKYQTISKMKNA